MGDWDVLELSALTHESLQSLLRNEVGAISVPNFVDKKHREGAYAALMRAPDWSFYEGTSPPLGRLGITQYEHHGAKDTYLDAAPSASARRSEILAPLPDPVDLVIDAFAAAWPGGVGVAEEDGRPYFAGIFRRGGGGGVKIHSDWGPRDGPGWAIGRITGQLAWNLFYSSPGVGGELITYDYPWEPHLEAHAKQRFSDYDPELFSSSRRADVTPQPGELMIFNSRNAHAVGSSPDGESRVAVGSFIGVTHDGDLAFWS
jgi:hypothetical protein